MVACAYIPARGESRRIERKNLQKIGERTLIEICVETTLRCPEFDHIVIDSDARDVLDICSKYMKDSRVYLLVRPKSLSGPYTPTPKIVLNMLDQFPDVTQVAVIHCTSPFLQAETISKAVQIFQTKGEAHDSLFTVETLNDYIWHNGPLNFSYGCNESTDNVKSYHKLTGGLFISTSKFIRENEAFIGPNPIILPLSKMEAWDLDHPEELEMARWLEFGRRKQNSEELFS